jgi:hypothetical protein
MKFPTLGKFIRPLLRISAAIALSACATDYQPIHTDVTGGYFHSKSSNDFYEVGFRANGFSGPKRAYDFAVLRAAELGNELGYPYFVIVGQDDRTSSETFTSGTTSTVSGQTIGNSFYGRVNTTPDTYTVRRPAVIIGVQYFEKPPPRRAGKPLYIPDTIDALRAAYDLPAPNLGQPIASQQQAADPQSNSPQVPESPTGPNGYRVIQRDVGGQRTGPR